MKRVLIVHPGLHGGGSEARALALIEMLQRDHEVTLLTCRQPDVAWLNRAYHSAVDPAKLLVELAPMPACVRTMSACDALRGAFLSRRVKRISPHFDLCIGAYNFTPFGRPAIQFIADFSWDDAYRRATDLPPPGWRGLLQRNRLLRAIYLGLCRLAAGGRGDVNGHRDDILVANSQWTADLLRSRHGLSARVIYPPVHHTSFDPAAPRSGDFVMLGRIAPDKGVVEAIELLAQVRARGHQFNFHVIGPLDRGVYASQVRALAERHGGWVRLAGGVVGDEKFRALARHSYGLHLRKREAFGIAVAEQVKMGLIPFVFARSAPAEIVGDRRLCFDTIDDAVELIDAVLRDRAVQDQIRCGLSARGTLFSRQRFIAEAGDLLRGVTKAKELPL